MENPLDGVTGSAVSQKRTGGVHVKNDKIVEIRAHQRGVLVREREGWYGSSCKIKVRG